MTHAANSTPIRPLSAGEQPRYQGLRRDTRGIIVGDVGIIALTRRTHLTAYLVALSQLLNLTDEIELARLPDEQGDRDEYLITIAPPHTAAPPSLVYDNLHDALTTARISPRYATLYVGDGQVFVPYAHPSFPHGCDVQSNSNETGVHRVLLHPAGSRPIAATQPLSLRDTLLTIPPHRTSMTHIPALLSVLTDRRLVSLIADYAYRHNLVCNVRYLTWDATGKPRNAALLDLASAREEQPIPAYVMAFLQGLSHTLLLSDAMEPATRTTEPSRRILVAWEHCSPLYLPHIQNLLPTGSLLILGSETWGNALLSPAPPRYTIQQMSEQTDNRHARAIASEQIPRPLRLNIHMKPQPQPQGDIHARLLDNQDLHRLRRMLSALPESYFRDIQIAIGDDFALLVATEPTQTIKGIPLGVACAYAPVPGLLLPRGMHLFPALPSDVLATLLNLPPDTLTVLTPDLDTDCIARKGTKTQKPDKDQTVVSTHVSISGMTPTHRYDVPRSTLFPLSRLLEFEVQHQHIALPAQPVTSAEHAEQSPVITTEPPEPVAHAPAMPATTPATSPSGTSDEQPSGGLWGRVRKGITRTIPPVRDGGGSASFDDELRKRARLLEQSGAYDIAAAFYTYLRDDKRAAVCYRRLLEG